MGIRTEFSAKVKRQAWERSGGRCEGVTVIEMISMRCGLKLWPGKFTYDHVVPAELGGASTLANCQVLGHCCDKPKTARDQAAIAKSRGVRTFHAGAKTPKRKIPGSKGSGVRRRMDGTVWRE